MYSLIKFHNDKYSVLLSKNIEKVEKGKCVVKYNGGKYSAFLVCQNDDKSVITDLKYMKEEKFQRSPLPTKPNPPSKPPKTDIAKNVHKVHVTRNTTNKTFKGRKRNRNEICKKTLVAAQEDQKHKKFEGKNHKNEICKTSFAPQEKTNKMFKEKNETCKTSFVTRQEEQINTTNEIIEAEKSNHNKNETCKTSFAAIQEEQTNTTNEIIEAEKSNHNENDTCKTSFVAPQEEQINTTIEIIEAEKSNCLNDIGTEDTEKKNDHHDSEEENFVFSSPWLSKNEQNFSNNLEAQSQKTLDFRFESPLLSNTDQNTRSFDNIKEEILLLDLTYVQDNKPDIISILDESQNQINITTDTSSKISKEESDIFNYVDNLDDEKSISISSLNISSLVCSSPNQKDSFIFLSPSLRNIKKKLNSTAEKTPDQTSLFCSSLENNEQTNNSLETNSETNCTEISIIRFNESSTSEYLPNSTTESKNYELSSSCATEKEKSTEVLMSPVKVSELVVPHSGKSKKHFCIFCNTLQTKFARHLFYKHKSQKEIKIALSLPKKCIERLKIINEIRKKGDFVHNTSKKVNSGILIVSRQQNCKAKNNADDYVCCKICRGFFSKTTIRIHLKKCGNKKKNERTNLIEGRRLTQYIHSAANDILKTKIFPVLRNDPISKAIRYDELAIKFANKMTEKYTLYHQHDMIRAQLLLLGRFKIEINKLNPDIIELKEIFCPSQFDNCVNALRVVANWDMKLMAFRTPAVATNLTTLIRKCGHKQRSEYIKTSSEDLEADVKKFLHLWDEEIPTLINKKALEDLTNQKRVKKIILPSKDDIQKLYSFLKTKIFNAMAALNKGFSRTAWVELVHASLIFIQIFNRRRAGEIERLTIENYENKEEITDNVEKDILDNVATETIEFAKQFVRITLRGKLGRTVSLLLCPLCISAINLILKFREKAGITANNPYIFSKTGTSQLSKQYYRACPLMQKFSEECGAEIPESLRGTTLRKHIATYTALLNIEESSVDKLANFMGHHKDIHKNIYRMSIPVSEITCVSKILMAAIGDEEDDDGEVDDAEIEKRGDNDDKEEIEEDTSEVNSFGKSNDNSTSSIYKSSPITCGKTKRNRWTSSERTAIHQMFGNLQELDKVPSLIDCLKAIRKYPALKKRTPAQLKTWIDNQRRYNVKMLFIPAPFFIDVLPLYTSTTLIYYLTIGDMNY